MNKLNTNRQLKKLFKTHSIACDILETKKNEFGEIEDDELVCTINGLFYEETSRVNLNINVNGSSTTTTYQTLMILKDNENEADKIRASMFCIIKGIKYEIIEVKNEGMLDIYYTLRLKVYE